MQKMCLICNERCIIYSGTSYTIFTLISSFQYDLGVFNGQIVLDIREACLLLCSLTLSSSGFSLASSASLNEGWEVSLGREEGRGK